EQKIRLPAEKISFEIEKDFSDLKSLGKLLSTYRYKPYGSINDDEMNLLVDKGEPTLILFLSSNEIRNENVFNFMNDLAVKYRRTLSIKNSTLDNGPVTVVVEVLRIKEENLPCILLATARNDTENADDLLKYRLDNAEMT